MSIAFRASRYERGDREEGDYINCPLNKEEYEAFIDSLLQAERIPLRSFEKEIAEGVRAGAHHYFEGCLPVEIIAERGRDSLAFGPMRPVGLKDPRSGKRPPIPPSLSGVILRKAGKIASSEVAGSRSGRSGQTLRTSSTSSGGVCQSSEPGSGLRVTARPPRRTGHQPRTRDRKDPP